MEKEKLQKLESIHVKLNYAYHSRNENVMKLLFKEFVPIALKRYHRSVVSGTIIALRAVPPVSL